MVERTSMYACDYDHLDQLNSPPLFDPAPSVKEIQRVEQIVSDCHMHLVSSPSSSMQCAADLKFVTDMWVFRWNECCTEVGGDALSDALFVARCYLLCARDPRTHDMAVFNDIKELYVRIQLLGCNHTRHRFDQVDSHMETVRLEERCAALVVFFLGQPPDELLQQLGPDPLPEVDDLLLAVIQPLRMVPDTTVPVIPEEQKQAEAKAKALALAEKAALLDSRVDAGVEVDDADEEKADASDDTEFSINEGAYWHSDKTSVVRGFVRMASRVLRNYWLNKMVFDMFPVRPVTQCPAYSVTARVCFVEWFKSKTANQYSDDSVKMYRNLIYEHWMPEGSRQEMQRTFSTKHDFMQSLNLLEHQLGVDSATSLAMLARVKTHLVSADPAHPVYDFLVLSQFSYLMQHLLGTDFLSVYYIQPGELGSRWKRLVTVTTWGQPRRPILLRILRGWWIHDAGEWVACTDVTDALLKIMGLWATKYDYKFVDNLSVAQWVAGLTTPSVKKK